MVGKHNITILFLDIGGVLLTDGWGHIARNKSAEHFNLNIREMNIEHDQIVDIYEKGELSLSEYLKRVVFYKVRQFTNDAFIEFMFNQSFAHYDAITFFEEIKKLNHLRVFAVSNEGRELNAFRVNKFKLNELFDAIISSSFVHLRKPDVAIFRMASDISQTSLEHSLYIDDNLMFVKVARTFGMNGIHYEGLVKLKNQLKEFGLAID